MTRVWLERGSLFAVLALVAWGPLAQGGAFAGGRAGVTALGGLAGAFFLASRAFPASSEEPPADGGAAWGLAASALILWSGVSTALAPYRYAAEQQAALLAGVLLAGIAANGVVRSARRRRAMGLWLLSVSALMAAYGLLQLFGLGFTLQADPRLSSSTYYNPSHFAGYITLALPVSLWVALFQREQAWRVLGGLTAAELTLLLLRTDASSTPTALLAGAGVITYFLLRSHPRAGRFFATTLVLGVLAVAVLFATAPGREALTRVTPSLGLHNSVQGFLDDRSPVWGMGFRLALSAPLSGYGPASFPDRAPRFRPLEHTPGNWAAFMFVNYAHNDYLQQWAELGLPGLGLYLLLILTTLLAPLRRDPLGTTLLIALACIWLSGLWDGHATVVPGTMSWVWSLAGISCAPAGETARSGGPLLARGLRPTPRRATR